MGSNVWTVKAKDHLSSKVTLGKEITRSAEWRVTIMFKLSRIVFGLVVIGGTLAGTHAQAHGGHFGHGGFGHGGYHHGGYGHGWYRQSYYYPSTYYQPAVTYAPAVTRYLVPAEYTGTPGGYLINYGGINYLTNGDGTMSPY